MASTSSLLLLCVGVGVLLLAVVSAENFVPHRTHLVDTNAASGNFLFRGNMPKTAQVHNQVWHIKDPPSLTHVCC